MNEATRPPRRITYVRPVYPEMARAKALGGLLQVQLTIDRDGNVARTTVLHSLPVFEAAALDAVRQWKYEPALRDGVPVEDTIFAAIRFPESAQGTQFVELRLGFRGIDQTISFNVWDRQRTALLGWRGVGSIFFKPVIQDAAQGRVVVSVEGEEGRMFGSVEVVAGGPLVQLDTLNPRVGIGVAQILEQ